MNRKRSLIPLLFLACAAWLSPLAVAQSSPNIPQDLPKTRIQAGMFIIQAQVAQTQSEHATGLMFRQQMPEHEGMLFIFPQAQPVCFWMKNTLIPLTAAFIADDGRIINLADMQPQSTQSHCAGEPVRYVLEMNQGWFGKRHISSGFKLVGGPFKN